MDLSILIPARNEMFLKHTVEDILNNMRGDTEIIVALDGQWANPPIKDHERVTILYFPESIGQRAAQNQAARISRAKYVMKVDAHCAFDEGFDVKMVEEMQDNWTMVPIMKNLHVFDWVCEKCGERWYMGPDPKKCKNDSCDSDKFRREMVWKPKRGINSTSYRFNRELRFKYFGQYKAKQKGDIVETMSLQGSCFMCTREKYWGLDLCDESWGSWGQQGTEVALKTWLSGGRVVCNKKTWYAHMFRTRAGFNWPYPPPGKSQRRARKISQDLFLNDKWPKATRKLQWLVDKFKPVPDWHGLTKGVLYYTDNTLDEKIWNRCKQQLKDAAGQLPITSVSLKPIEFGKNIVFEGKRGHLTLFKQILAGLEAMKAEIVFFAEHDVLYHKSHFDFVPPSRKKYYYNVNVWKVRVKDGHALKVDNCKMTSGLCAYRDLLIKHYKKRIEMVEKNGFSRKMGFEPGTHNRKQRVDDVGARSWESKVPNLDLCHNTNFTKRRWKKSEWRNQKYTKGWTEAKRVPGWRKLNFLYGTSSK